MHICSHVAVVVLAALVSVGTMASVFGGSNFSSFLGYPSHDCNKPQKPHKPYEFSSQWEVDLYNDQVRRYNRELGEFVDCIQEYLDNARNDIKRIQKKAQEAIDDLESPY